MFIEESMNILRVLGWLAIDAKATLLKDLLLLTEGL